MACAIILNQTIYIFRKLAVAQVFKNESQDLYYAHVQTLFKLHQSVLSETCRLFCFSGDMPQWFHSWHFEVIRKIAIAWTNVSIWLLSIRGGNHDFLRPINVEFCDQNIAKPRKIVAAKTLFIKKKKKEKENLSWYFYIFEPITRRTRVMCSPIHSFAECLLGLFSPQ